MENFPFSVMNEAIFENRDRIREKFHFLDRFGWQQKFLSNDAYSTIKDLCKYFERYSTGCNKIIELKKCKANMIFELKQKHNL